MKQKTKQPTGELSITPNVSIKEGMAEFQQSLKAGQDQETARMNEIELLCYLGEVVLASKPAFSFPDFWQVAKANDVEYGAAKSFFGKWIDALLNFKKIDVTNGLDGDLYIVLN